MKKIIAAVNALSFSEQELDNYKYIADKARGKLTILFLENLAGESILQPLETGYIGYDALFAESVKARQEKADANRKKLVRYFQDNCLEVTVRSLSGVPANEVLKETRFADLLLIKNTTSFSVWQDSNPPLFIREMLADAQCPVMVLPETIHYLREVIFTYNGTFSSMFAIRQFTQLFDGLSETPVKVVHIVEGEDKKVPNGRLLKEYLGHHYEEVTYLTREGSPSGELMALTIHGENSVITFGAYGRSKASRFFHRSDADCLLRTTNIPIFITHP